MTRKHDYDSLKRQYVTGSMSIRELCRQNDISSWSTVSEIAKRENWEEMRIAYAREVESRALMKMADTEADKIAKIRLDALDVIHAGILKMGSDMEHREPILDPRGNPMTDEDGSIMYRPAVIYSPAQLATLIDKLLSLSGQPSQIHEERKLGIDVSTPVGEDTLRELLARLRPPKPVGGGEGTSPDVDPSRARPN